MKFFKYYGSYEGAVLVKGRWVRVKGFEYVSLAGYFRHQGPPTPAIARALSARVAIDARTLFPSRVISPLQ